MEKIKITLSYAELDIIRNALEFMEECHTDNCDSNFEKEHKDFVKKINVIWDKLTKSIPDPIIKKKKDNSKKNDLFIFCRSCNATITNDFRSKFDKRYCRDCL